MGTTYDAITDELSEDELRARLSEIDCESDEFFDAECERVAATLGHVREAVTQHEAEEELSTAEGYRYFRPLVEAADEYISWAESPHQRIYTGIPQFDAVMRGIAPRELLLCVGYTHSGKTVFTTEVILNNRDRRIAMFTPDETRVAVLVKLASIVHGISAEDLEDRIYHQDPEAKSLVRSTALRNFPNLAVFEDAADLSFMDLALDECCSWWGDRPELAIFDYSKLLEGVDDIPAKITALKSWGKRQEVPLVVLHQSSRTAGSDGRVVGIDSGEYGGEQQAIFLVGVRRKLNQYMARIRELEEKLEGTPRDRDLCLRQITEARAELERHRDTVTFSLLKNKRPPCRLVDDIDFFLDPLTGRITPLNEVPPKVLRSAAQARQAARFHQSRHAPTLWGSAYRPPDDDEEPF